MYLENVLQSLAFNARQGGLVSMQATMLSTLGVLAYNSITLPDGANGFRIYPSAAVRFAINEDPVAITTTFVAGAVADATAWTSKMLVPGISRTLRFTAASTATTVIIDAF